MSEWISVKDELPKTGERVRIAYLPKGDFHWANFRWHQGYTDGYSAEIQEPTHWQPRPDPPDVDDE